MANADVRQCLSDMGTEFVIANFNDVLPQYFNRCARCREEKLEGGVLGRFDCTSMYTYADMQRVEEVIAPETQRRYREHTGRSNVTVDHTPHASARPGGVKWNTFQRTVFTAEELLRRIKYENRMNILRLGRS